jgi:radical SAM family uncharacterized protein
MHMSEDILLQVNKPARYTGGEWNASRKDFAAAGIKFALCFPDLYEIGMSNLGIRILYGILNSIEDCCCERVFACNDDLENILRAKGGQIFSLESQKTLGEFDIIGFSLGSELGYTNVLNILDLGGIPLAASLRGREYPLIIAGGPCALNPEPMHEFFDLFVIGEAEELVTELIDVYRENKEKYKSGKIGKSDLLAAFTKIPGVYVPSLYEVSYGPDGAVKGFKAKTAHAPQTIKKRIVKDLDSAYFPLQWLVPYIQIVHDRVSLEVMRGCPNQCRFCQARQQYFPLRIRKAQNILELASQAYKRTGYEEISLCGLSVTDYPQIEKLLQSLMDTFRYKTVSISLPSIKPKAYVGELSRIIAQMKKTGLTFAPEAASKRLRDILAKDFDEEEFFRALEQAYLCGYQHVKLYFMTGLPREEEADLDGILDFARRVSELRRKAVKFPAQVNISINTMIPKPHTAFQWLEMESLEKAARKNEYLKAKLKNRRIKLSFHSREMSFLEGVLSRGDRRLSAVVEAAFKKGARFDAWSNHFNLQRWLEVFNEAGINPDFYLKERPTDEFLPWDFIDIGVSKESLLREANNAKPVAI